MAHASYTRSSVVQSYRIGGRRRRSTALYPFERNVGACIRLIRHVRRFRLAGPQVKKAQSDQRYKGGETGYRVILEMPSPKRRTFSASPRARALAASSARGATLAERVWLPARLKT